MTTIRMSADDALTVELPGLTAIRIDGARRLIAIDGTSGNSDVPLYPEWVVLDLRDGIYGGFHRLLAASECFDPVCGGSGQHAVTSTATSTQAVGPGAGRRPVVRATRSELASHLVNELQVPRGVAEDLTDLEEGAQWTADLGEHAPSGIEDVRILACVGGWYLMVPLRPEGRRAFTS